MLRIHFYKRKSLSATSFDGRNQSNTYTFIYIFLDKMGLNDIIVPGMGGKSLKEVQY